MPKFTVIVQKNVSPDAAERAVRSIDFSAVEMLTVTASSLSDAVLQVATARAHDEQPPRIVSAEEVFELNADAISDETLLEAMAEQFFEDDWFESYTAAPLVRRDDFDRLVDDVAAALRDHGIVPGLSLSLLHDDNGVFEYSMVEIHDQATGTYRAVGRDPRDLIADTSLTGREAFLSVARTLIHAVATGRLL